MGLLHPHTTPMCSVRDFCPGWCRSSDGDRSDQGDLPTSDRFMGTRVTSLIFDLLSPSLPFLRKVSVIGYYLQNCTRQHPLYILKIVANLGDSHWIIEIIF